MTRTTVKIPFPEFHPAVNTVAKSLYESGHFTDALRRASIKLEEECKKIYKEKTGNEASGTQLMAKLFCEKDGKVCMPMTNLSIKDGSDRQKSIYFLFSGCIGAIRNPIAHESDDLEDVEALYGLNIVSYLFHKLEQVTNKKEAAEEKVDIIISSTVDLETIETSLMAILLEDDEIKSIADTTTDKSNAKLSIKKRVQEILTDQLNIVGEDTYNAFFADKEFQEKIYHLILEKIYE